MKVVVVVLFVHHVNAVINAQTTRFVLPVEHVLDVVVASVVNVEHVHYVMDCLNVIHVINAVNVFLKVESVQNVINVVNVDPRLVYVFGATNVKNVQIRDTFVQVDFIVEDVVMNVH